MSRVKYHYALDEHNRLVHINDVDRDNRNSHIFHCLNCGAEMVPRMGDVRAWHFSHSAGEEHCGTETYLHKLAKRLIRMEFENKPSFNIRYCRDVVCSDVSTCPFAKPEWCHSAEPETFDLKQYYDTCKEEQEINGYIADLMLTSSEYPKREPVLIEIQVTHKSTESKRTSGLKIIEIKIESEDDIRNLISGTLEESRDDYLGRRNAGPVKFYGFKDKSVNPRPLENRSIQRFYLFRSGKAFVTNMDEFKSCRDVWTKDNDKAIFEASIDSDYLGKPSPYDFGYMAARQNGIQVRTCQFCKYHKNGYEVGFGMQPIFCCLYKKYGTPENPEPQYAGECEYYREDRNVIDEISSQMPVIAIARSK